MVNLNASNLQQMVPAFRAMHHSQMSSAPKKSAAPSRTYDEIPAKPKKPLTSYQEFVSSNREGVKKANPSIRSPEIFKIVGEMWRNLDAVEKERYEKEYLLRKEEHNKAMELWSKNLSEEELSLYDAYVKAAKVEKNLIKRKQADKRKQNRERKALLQQLQKPKRPITPYMLYRVKQKYAVGEEKAEFEARLSQQYKNLPNSEIEALEKEFRLNQKQYRLALDAWKERMISEGRYEIVSKTS